MRKSDIKEIKESGEANVPYLCACVSVFLCVCACVCLCLCLCLRVCLRVCVYMVEWFEFQRIAFTPQP